MKAKSATCKACLKQQPVTAFSPEFNPKGQQFTCKFCISKGQVYCPIHEACHPKATLADFKFKMGQDCPHSIMVQAVASQEPTPLSAPPPNPASALAHSFDLIAKRLSALEGIQESVTRVDKIFSSVHPLLESLVARMAPVPVSNPERLAELEAQAVQHKADLEGAMAEWSKAEERAKALEQKLAENEAALANLVASHNNLIDLANNFESFAKKLT